MSWFKDPARDAPETRSAELPPGRQTSRAAYVAAGAVAVVAVLVLTGLAPRWHRAEPVTPAQPRPPAAVVAAAYELLGVLEPGYIVTGPAEWVRTTRRAYERLAGYREPGLDEELYVVQVHGLFTCAACSRPYGAAAQTGSAALSGLPVDGAGETMGGIGPPEDLSRLGTVHTFPVS
jgi:hypothetical protein